MSHEHELEDYYVYFASLQQIRHRCSECGVWGIGPASWCAGDDKHPHFLNSPDDRYVP